MLVYVEAQRIQEWIDRKLDALEVQIEETRPDAYGVGLLTGEFKILQELSGLVKQSALTAEIIVR